MNLSDMRTLVRRDLHDEDSNNYRWTNDEIDRHISNAVKDFSEALPLEQKAAIATTSCSREISISTVTNRVMVEAVEYPAGNFPQRYQRFTLWADTLTLLGDEVPDGSNCYVYYSKLHTLDTSTSTIPAKCEDLIVAGACGYAALSWAVYAVNQVNNGGDETVADFLIYGKEKLSFFKGELKRLGRRNRVRVNRLYQPYYAPVSKTTDWGP